jgi:hypothetical protein
MKQYIKLEYLEKGLKILYLCCDNEEDYYNGNHDKHDDYFIPYEKIENINDENEIKYLVSLRDINYNESDIIIL